MGIIISVVNNKGGIGKTTTTCNLADALGKKKKRVLVVDIDAQCNTTSNLMPDNIHIRKSLLEILDPTEDDINISETIYPTNLKNVSILPNIGITGGLEPDMIMNAPESFFRLRNKLRDYALNHYDYCIIDNPPNMGSFVICSLYASDCVIVPIDSGSGASVEGLLKALSLIGSVKKQGNPDLKFLRLLINRYDARTAVSITIANRVNETFGAEQVFKTIIPSKTGFQKSELLKKTIFTVDKSSKGAAAFRNLAAELISIVED
ncbi:ParA family protein [Desulforegula conservatrix]|uniref:ParA family protein n=1 Tax=Desulforegula conservatrix TaxID=153026 RepID=UPI00040E6490|nr:ParA family protein [Desulforegula conservatrix]